MKMDLSGFPPLPPHQAQGMAVYMEPIAGSSERICVAVAAGSADLGYSVQPVIRHNVAQCMLGDAGAGFMSMVETTASSLQHHLNANGTFSEWQPPLSGVIAGDVDTGRVHDLNMMLRSIARSHGFLSSLSDFSAENLGQDDDTNLTERWVRDVMRAVCDTHPDFKGYFKRRRRLFEGGRERRFDFLGARNAIQLGRIAPGPGLAANTRSAEAKLWALEALRDNAKSELFEVNNFELIVQKPTEEEASLCSEKDMARMNEALLDLIEAGDRQELRVKEVSYPEQAADRIIRLEAA